MTNKTFLECFLRCMCVLLHTFCGSVLTLIGFATFTESTLCFQDFVHSLGYSKSCDGQIYIVHTLMELANSKSTMYFYKFS